MKIERKPDWLKIRLGSGENYARVKKIVDMNRLHTICDSGKCPNIGQCWSLGTATFMILGDICTRSCKFCATKTGKPLPIDRKEAEGVAESVKLMGLKHCVITSVDRDDLADLGAGHWADTIRKVREKNPNTVIETLIPDFDARKELLDIVIEANPDIIGHNMETVKRLTPMIRSRARYDKSLETLRYIVKKGMIAKSGVMAGIGETADEIEELMLELREAGCRLLTIGQYLRPAMNNIPVDRYVTPEEFEQYKIRGIALGFDHIESGPLVRSSYMAERTFMESKIIK